KWHCGDHHRKNATWRRDLMPANNLIVLPIPRVATDDAWCLTTSLHACRIAVIGSRAECQPKMRRHSKQRGTLQRTMEKETSHDVIVIGGGPAGSTAATLLSRQNHRVLLLEREKFPREHVGESLLPFCFCLLQDLGVVDQIKKNFVRKPGVRF